MFAVTSLVVTHDMKSAFDIADRIAYLKHGRIYFEGTGAELQASDDQDIQDFIAGRSRGSARTTRARHNFRRESTYGRRASSESSTLELRVGLFVLVGLAIIGYMVVVLGRFGNGVKPSYTLTVELPNASGLLKNSKVLMAGAQVGSVVDGPNLLDHARGVAVRLRISRADPHRAQRPGRRRQQRPDGRPFRGRAPRRRRTRAVITRPGRRSRARAPRAWTT